jgi:hypothetical protein
MLIGHTCRVPLDEITPPNNTPICRGKHEHNILFDTLLPYMDKPFGLNHITLNFTLSNRTVWMNCKIKLLLGFLNTGRISVTILMLIKLELHMYIVIVSAYTYAYYRIYIILHKTAKIVNSLYFDALQFTFID